MSRPYYAALGSQLSKVQGIRAERAQDILRVLYVLAPHLGKLQPGVVASVQRLAAHADRLADAVGVDTQSILETAHQD